MQYKVYALLLSPDERLSLTDELETSWGLSFQVTRQNYPLARGKCQSQCVKQPIVAVKRQKRAVSLRHKALPQRMFEMGGVKDEKQIWQE